MVRDGPTKKIRAAAPFMLAIVVALMVGMLTIIRVPCPTCSGTGVLTAAQGLKIEMISGELTDFTHFDLACIGVWGIFTYDVNILVTNEGASPKNGYVVVNFYPPDKSVPSLKTPVYVEIPAETTEDVERVLVYEGFVAFAEEAYDPYTGFPEPHRLEAEIGEEVICPHCDGEGKMLLTEWLKLMLK